MVFLLCVFRFALSSCFTNFFFEPLSSENQPRVAFQRSGFASCRVLYLLSSTFFQTHFFFKSESRFAFRLSGFASCGVLHLLSSVFSAARFFSIGRYPVGIGCRFLSLAAEWHIRHLTFFVKNLFFNHPSFFKDPVALSRNLGCFLSSAAGWHIRHLTFFVKNLFFGHSFFFQRAALPVGEPCCFLSSAAGGILGKPSVSSTSLAAAPPEFLSKYILNLLKPLELFFFKVFIFIVFKAHHPNTTQVLRLVLPGLCTEGFSFILQEKIPVCSFFLVLGIRGASLRSTRGGL